jgi:hypothetical protein
VRFELYPKDHVPHHAHAFYADGEVIVELLPNGSVRVADRRDALRGKVKTSDVGHILTMAAEQYEALVQAWEAMHP